MCRFALLKTTAPTRLQEVLGRFSTMAQASRAPDGDLQGDGWGVTWRQNGAWQRHASLNPVWESRSEFSRLPETDLFLVHARSASFAQGKNNVAFNQPFISGKYAFVFNGLLKGMRYPRPVAGEIGAQKIWSLLQEFLAKDKVETAIEKTTAQLNTYARQVQGLNLGVSDGQRLYVYSQFNGNVDYYTLHASRSSGKIMVSSEPLTGELFNPLEPKKVHVFE